MRRSVGLLLLLLTLIVILAAALRFVELDGQSLWADEGNSAALATRSLTQIAKGAAGDIHPPLYYWLLHIWTQTFGVSEIALRSLSAVIGVLLVLSVAGLARLLFDDIIALGAAFFAAIAPFQVYYSQEARMYILVALEATVAVALFFWFVRNEDRRLGSSELDRLPMRFLPFSGMLLAVVWAAGLYTHYAFPLIIALCTGFYAAWLIISRKRGRKIMRLARWLLLLVLTLVLYAPWLQTAIRQLTTWPGVDGSAGLLDQVRTVMVTLVLGPAASPDATLAAAWLFVIALLGVLPWGLGVDAHRGDRVRLDWMRQFLPLGLMLAPAAMILGLGLFRGSYLKFLLIGSPALAVLLARAAIGPAQWLVRGDPLLGAEQSLGVVALGRPRGSPRDAANTIAAFGWPLVVFSLAGALSLTTLTRYYNDPVVARDDYRGIAQFIAATEQAGDAVLLSAPGQSEVFLYYYRGQLPVVPLPRQRPIDASDTLSQLDELLKRDKIYAVFWALNEADPAGIIESWLNGQGYKTLDQWHGNVRLVVYEMPERHPPDEVTPNLNARFGEHITLNGYAGWNLNPMAGDVTQLQLSWQTDAALHQRYKVFLQLLDPRDQVIVQSDAEPGGDGRPTNTWQPGETIVDNHGLFIPPGTPPGSYRRIIGLYDATTMERLRLSDGSDFVSLPPVQVERSRTPPPIEALNMQYTQQFDFGGITLLGHDRYERGAAHQPDKPVHPGDLLHVTFYWRANAAPRADWWFKLTLDDTSGRTLASLSAPLVAATYPTTLWQQGEIVRGEHDLPIPSDLPPGSYQLSLVLLPDVDTEAGITYLGAVKIARP